LQTTTLCFTKQLLIWLYNFIIMARIIFIFLAFGFTCGVASAQDNNNALLLAFDSVIKQELKEKEPGVSAIVVKNGQVLYKKGYGMADMELNVPIQADMIFRIGSITKQFTAICILQLAQQGKLSLQDDIKKYIPDYSIKTPITIEHLLTHTSGIKNYTSIDSLWTHMRNDLTPRAIIALTEKDTLEFVPGSKWNYNNTGYVMLGYIIEKITGISYAKYVKENIFKPADMKNSYYGSESQLIKNRAKGYKNEGVGIQNADYISMTIPHAAGALLSSVEDLWKWTNALHSFKLVNQQWLQKAFVPYLLANGKSSGYGYGFLFGNLQGSKTIEHDGGIPGFLSQGIYLPDEKVFVAVLSNCECKSPSDMAAKLAAIAIGKPYQFKAIAMSSESAKAHEGVFVSADGEKRIISWDKDHLTSQRNTGKKFTIFPFEKDNFFFEKSLSTITFQRNNNGEVVAITFKNRTDETVWTKTTVADSSNKQ
jgi:CubicO group peptidase (beta-lactamase class C family)